MEAETRRRIREAVAVVGVLAAPLAVVAGYLSARPLAVLGGLVALLVAVVAGRRLVTYEDLLRDVSHRGRSTQVRAWTILKIVGILVHLILLAAVVLLSVATGSRLGIVDIGTFPADTTRVALGTFTAAVVGGLALTHHLSMRVRLRRGSGGYRTLQVLASVGAAVAVTVLAFLVGEATVRLGPLTLTATDVPFLQLAAAALAGAAVFSARAPPTLGLLVVGEEEYYRGHTHLSRQRSIAAPALTAVGLLMVFLVGAMALIVGLSDLVGAVTGDLLVTGLVAALVAVAVAAIAAALVFWEGAEETPTYRAAPDRAKRRDTLAIATSATLGGSSSPSPPCSGPAGRCSASPPRPGWTSPPSACSAP